MYSHKRKLSSRFDNSQEDVAASDPSQILMLKKMNTMGVLLESLCRDRENNRVTGELSGRLSITFQSKNFKMFPANTKEEICSREDKMSSKKFYAKVVLSICWHRIFWQVLALSKIGKHATMNMNAANLLKHVLTYKAGQKFSFEGRSQKKCWFKNLKLYSAIKNAMDILYPDVTAVMVKKSVSEWLTQCKNRQKRKMGTGNRIIEKERRMHLDLEDDDQQE